MKTPDLEGQSALRRFGWEGVSRRPIRKEHEPAMVYAAVNLLVAVPGHIAEASILEWGTEKKYSSCFGH